MITDLKPYPGMKDTGLPWCPQVPSHWDLKPNRAFLRQRKVLVGARHAEYTLLSLTKQGVIVRNVTENRGKFSSDMGTSQIVRPGDLVMCLFDVPETPRTVGLSKHLGMITGAYTVFEARDQEIARWTESFYTAMDDRKLLSPLYSGLRNTIPSSRFLGTKSPMPPLPEQAAVVRFLGHVDRRVRRLVRAKRKLIALLTEQKQAIVHRAVTRGLDPNVPLKDSGVEWLGQVPKHWEVLVLKRVLRRLIDCEHETAPAVDESEFRVVRTAAVRNGSYSRAGTYGTTAAAYREWTRRGAPEPGDVIFTREAPAGESCLVPAGEPVCLGQRTVLMKLREDEYSPEFLVHMIYGGPPRTRIQLASHGSTVGHFNMDDIGWMPIYKPPLPEQLRIVEYLDGATRSIGSAVDRASSEIELLNEYRTRLVADVVTGKVDVRGAAAALPDEDPLDAEDEDAEDDLDDAVDPGGEANVEGLDTMLEGAEA